MGTEDRAPIFIDEMRPYRALQYLLKDLEAPRAVKHAVGQIHDAVIAASKRLSAHESGNEKGRIVYVGAGTSGRLGTLDSAELFPTFGWPHERTLSIMAGGDFALTRSVEGSEDDFEKARAKIVEADIGQSDVVIVIAASGTTPFTLAALRESKRRRALVIGIANNVDSALVREANYPIVLDTGAEPIAGSTRMKAGTAQCVVLKTISTLIMVNLGYVYKGLMVNVRATNEKLKIRAIKMVQTIVKCDEEAARDALEKASWEVGVAVLLFGGEDVESAEALYFTLCHRNLHQAIMLTDLAKTTR